MKTFQQIYENSLVPNGQGGALRPQGLMIHHSGGRGTVQGVINVLKQRGLAYHYIIDREGKVNRIGDINRQAWHAGVVEKLPRFNNQTTIGISLIANDENDVLPEQRQACQQLAQQLGQQYGFDPTKTTVGHGEATSRKQPTEGATAKMIRGEATPEMLNAQSAQGQQSGRSGGGNIITRAIDRVKGAFKKKNIPDLVKDVIAGKYGNGNQRKQKLDSEFGPGTYQEVQAAVNKELQENLNSFIEYSNNYKQVTEQMREEQQNARFVKHIREGKWTPTEKFTEAYVELIPHISKDEWPLLRETLMLLAYQESRIFNPSFALRENKSNLLEDYFLTAAFSNPLIEKFSLDERFDDTREKLNEFLGGLVGGLAKKAGGALLGKVAGGGGGGGLLGGLKSKIGGLLGGGGGQGGGGLGGIIKNMLAGGKIDKGQITNIAKGVSKQLGDGIKQNVLQTLVQSFAGGGAA